MIRVRFKIIDGLVHGFQISGHAETDVMGRDILCAAVSSAAEMTANTITEIIGAPATIASRSGFLYLRLARDAEKCQDIFSGFRLHIQALSEEYPTRIQFH